MQSYSVGGWVGSSRLDSANTVSISVGGDPHVTIFSPGSSPGVSEDKVVLTSLSTVTDESNSVVKVGSTGGLVEDTALVHLEDEFVGLNSNRDWVLGNSSLDLRLTSWSDISVVKSSNSGISNSSILASSSAGTVGSVGISSDGGVALVVGEGVLLKSTSASEVSV